MDKTADVGNRGNDRGSAAVPYVTIPRLVESDVLVSRRQLLVHALGSNRRLRVAAAVLLISVVVLIGLVIRASLA